jgi:parallel beta-helix repeat protein
MTTLTLGSYSVLAADLYVSPNGNNNNSGATKEAALSTISKAALLAKAGTTVHVAPGVYNENIRTNAVGTSSARIRYVSDEKWGAKIIGSGTEFMWANYGNYTDIVGFDISGPGRGGIMNMGSYVLMSSNHVHDLKVSGGCTGNGGAGIVNANYSATDGDIIGNVVHDIGIPGSCNGVQGIYYSNLRGNISNNIVYRVAAFGIHLWHAASNVIISNNTVYANGSSSMGGGIVIGTGDSPGGVILDNTKVINNIVYNNPASSIVEYCYSGQNCIGANNVISNNLVYGNGKGISLKVGAALNTITADPQFINYQANGSGNYHLKSTSPAIDRGVAMSAFLADNDGYVRKGIPDIGALEFISTISPKASFSSLAVSFENTYVGSKSSKIITISSVGDAPLMLSKLNISGDFAISNSSTCELGKSYAPGSSCNVEVNFYPSSAGALKGVLGVESNSNPSLTNVALSGTGLVVQKPVASVSVSSLNFGSIKVGTKSVVKIITITNTGNAPLTITKAFTITGNFSFGGKGTCGVSVSYAPGASCTASLVFAPKTLGLQTGSILFESNAAPKSVNLSGTGIR